MASPDPFDAGNQEKEEEEDERFGSSTGFGKLRGRLGSMSPPSMPAFMTPSGGKHSPTVIKSFLAVGIFIAFVAMCMLAVIVSQLNSRKPYPNLCVSNDCLEEAATVLDFVNRSVDPCVNFYQYACGNYPTVYPADGFWDIKDAWTMLDDQNTQFLEDTLTSGVINVNSAEEKAKIFYQDCTNEYLKTDMGGKPLIDAVNSLGGWFGLYSFNSKNWGSKQVINSAIQSSHATYAISPFFTIEVNADYQNKPVGHPPEQWVIEVLLPYFEGKQLNEVMFEFNIAPLALASWYDYVTPTSHSSQRHLAAYTTFIKTVLTLLWKDDGNLQPPQPTDLMNQVVADVLEMETAIANITYNTLPDYGKDQYKPISYLVGKYSGLIDWLALLQSYFPNTGITANTVVHLHEENYLGAIATYLTNLFNNRKTDAPRMLNNYIMWSITRQYATDLGWEYTHANRDWAMAKYDGYVYFTGQQKWCVIEMQRNVQYLLSHIYVMDHFDETAHQKANDVFDYIRNTLKSRVDGYAWMDSSAKDKAKLKLTSLQKQVGYPKWLADTTQINTYYAKLAITKGSSFMNIVQLTAFSRYEDEQKIIKGKVDPGDWPTGIYSGDVTLVINTNTLYIPAGFLQRPMFDGRVPQYMNFASMGRFAGGLMTGDIDYWGCHYDEHGWTQDWWPQSTIDAFNSQISQCEQNLFVNQTYDYGGSRPAGQPMPHPLTFAQVGWRDVAALNIAYDSYRAYIADNGVELGLPGFQSESIDQAFFTAFAQTWCESADPLLTWYYYSWWYNPIPENLVNTVMQQMPQFAPAFQCTPDTPMGVPLSCTGF